MRLHWPAVVLRRFERFDLTRKIGAIFGIAKTICRNGAYKSSGELQPNHACFSAMNEAT